MAQIAVFTFASPEIAEFLYNNNVDVADLLEKDGAKVQAGSASDPSLSGTKDAATVILASAALVATMQPVLKRLLEGLLYRPIRVTELVPVETPGLAVSDGQTPGEVTWVERSSIVANAPPEEKSRLVVGFAGFKFEYETGPSQR